MYSLSTALVRWPRLLASRILGSSPLFLRLLVVKFSLRSVLRCARNICYAQWTMERTIGNLGQEIRQPSKPYENLAEEGLRRSRVLRFHLHGYFSLTVVFLLRVCSQTLCAQWTCHVLRTRLPRIPASRITCH